MGNYIIELMKTSPVYLNKTENIGFGFIIIGSIFFIIFGILLYNHIIFGNAIYYGFEVYTDLDLPNFIFWIPVIQQLAYLSLHGLAVINKEDSFDDYQKKDVTIRLIVKYVLLFFLLSIPIIGYAPGFLLWFHLIHDLYKNIVPDDRSVVGLAAISLFIPLIVPAKMLRYLTKERKEYKDTLKESEERRNILV